ncbi:MAG TPA: tetratricopeptide repeat protein, partial [Campylobacteraceae bacterium]|nr:tetratricopeptide repeat protein [Campylobacteraceae bacterium]
MPHQRYRRLRCQRGLLDDRARFLHSGICLQKRMSTLTLARIYEKQGHLADALQIYREHLRKNPEDRELRAAVL